MNPLSQTLIFIAFVVARTLRSGVYFVFRQQAANTRWLSRKAQIVWKQLHGFCVLGGAYFALLTFQVLAYGLNFEVQFA